MQLFWQRHTPGTAPGTLAVAEPAKEPPRSHLAVYGPGVLNETEVASPDEVSKPGPGLVGWLDVQTVFRSFVTATGDAQE